MSLSVFSLLSLLKESLSPDNVVLRKFLSDVRSAGIKFRIASPSSKKVKIARARIEDILNETSRPEKNVWIVDQAVEVQLASGQELYLFLVGSKAPGHKFIYYVIVPLFFNKGSLVDEENLFSELRAQKILSRLFIWDSGDYEIHINTDGGIGKIVVDEKNVKNLLTNATSPVTRLLLTSKDNLNMFAELFKNISKDQITVVNGGSSGGIIFLNVGYMKRFSHSAGVLFRPVPVNPTKMKVEAFIDNAWRRFREVDPFLQFKIASSQVRIDITDPEKAARDAYDYVTCIFDAFKKTNKRKIMQFIEKHGLDGMNVGLETEGKPPNKFIIRINSLNTVIYINEVRVNNFINRGFSVLRGAISLMDADAKTMELLREAVKANKPNQVEFDSDSIHSITHGTRVYYFYIYFKPNVVSIPLDACKKSKDFYVTHYLAPALDMSLGAISDLVKRGVLSTIL